MDALALLKGDHRTVEALFRRLEKAGPRALKLKRRCIEEVIRELSVHASIEEEYFYPAVRARAKELNDEVLVALEEHHTTKLTLKELERLPAEQERFDAKVHVLMANIRHHIAEEEKDLFVHARKIFKPQELQYLGELLERAKKAAPTHPHPLAPDTPPANLVADTLTAVLDMGRDALRTIRRRATATAEQGDVRARDMEAARPQ
jgi:Hemerythrin HHE cation binding domain